MPPGTGAALDDEGEQATALILIEALNKAPFVLALRYLAFAAFSVLLYDYLLTFPDEVAYFWQGRKTWPSLLFFLNRYLPILATLFNMIGQLVEPPSDMVCQLWLKGLLTWAPAVEIFASHCILAARLNAVYGNKRNVRIILAACLSVATAGYVSILVWNVAQMKVTSHPLPHLAPNLRVCFSQHLAQVAWTLLPVLVFEIVCFTALVHKVLRQLKNDHGSYGFGHHCKSSCPHCRNGIVNCNFKRAQRTLHHVILRDNFVYFMIAICIFAAEAAMWSRLSPPESELMDYPAVAIVSILSNRMLFNIRAQAERNGFHGSSLGTLTAAAVAMLSEADRAAMEKRSEELDDIPMRTVPKPTRKSKSEKMGKRLKSESTWDGDEIRMELERMALDRVRSYDFEGVVARSGPASSRS
ncbi:hypothetical protein BKA62DRAFT_234667 [Auriculariales sp. MPI-PUGE-AT-0066]|nr:hypothetical protein BKA62DRAFT_234667 [Auriculariales sp. MPI-PUGE-AT-0066]